MFRDSGDRENIGFEDCCQNIHIGGSEKHRINLQKNGNFWLSYDIKKVLSDVKKQGEGLRVELAHRL
jgi:hypothetical protein